MEVNKAILEGMMLENAFTEIINEGKVKDTVNRWLYKTFASKKHQDKLCSSGSISDLHLEISGVSWHIKNNKTLSADEKANLKIYLSNLKARYTKLGGDAAYKANEKRKEAETQKAFMLAMMAKSISKK